MNKNWFNVLILASGLTAVSAFAGGQEEVLKPNYFNGLFVGGTGAYHNLEGYYGAQAGVGKVVQDRWYVGVVGFWEWGTQSDDSEYDKYNNGWLTGVWKSSSAITNNYGVAFRPGFLLLPRTLVYGKIGPVWAQTKVTNTTPFGSVESRGTKNALLVGGGVEQFLYHDVVSLNLEYNYSHYGTVATSLPVNSTTTLTSSVNTKVNTVLAGINIYFGSHWF